MTKEDMMEILYELIIVETEPDFVKSHSAEGNAFAITTKDNESFKITVEKL